MLSPVDSQTGNPDVAVGVECVSKQEKTRKHVQCQDGACFVVGCCGSIMVAIRAHFRWRYIVRLRSASDGSSRLRTPSCQREGHETLRVEEGAPRIFAVDASKQNRR